MAQGDPEPSPFVGRALERSWLTERAAGASELDGRLVVVTGPSGIGKTRLGVEALDGIGRPWRPLGRPDDLTGDTDAALLDDIHLWPAEHLEALASSELPTGAFVLATCGVGVEIRRRRRRVALANLVRRSDVSVLALGPLRRPDSDRLARHLGVSSASERDALHKRSGGSPFFLEELARDRDVDVPWTVCEVVDELNNLLSPDARRRLEVLAVAAAPLPVSTVSELARTEPTGELTDSGIVSRSAGLERLRHDIVGEAVQARLPAERLRCLHTRLADALTRGGADPAAVAGHLRAGAALDSDLATPVLRADLTPRDVDLLQLLAWGHTNKDIAAALHLAPATVRNQLHGLFAKLHVSRRAQAAALAVRLGLGGEPRPG